MELHVEPHAGGIARFNCRNGLFFMYYRELLQDCRSIDDTTYSIYLDMPGYPKMAKGAKPINTGNTLSHSSAETGERRKERRYQVRSEHDTSTSRPINNTWHSGPSSLTAASPHTPAEDLALYGFSGLLPCDLLLKKLPVKGLAQGNNFEEI